jgi:hypothetical protein
MVVSIKLIHDVPTKLGLEPLELPPFATSVDKEYICIGVDIVHHVLLWIQFG